MRTFFTDYSICLAGVGCRRLEGAPADLRFAKTHPLVTPKQSGCLIKPTICLQGKAGAPTASKLLKKLYIPITISLQ